MKSLRDSIYKDFDSMIDYGNEAGYIPPPQSIEQQAKDGSLFNEGQEDDLKPPTFKAENPTDIAGDAANVELDPSKVNAIQNALKKTSQEEERQLEDAVDNTVAAAAAPVNAAFAPPSSSASSSPSSPSPAPATNSDTVAAPVPQSRPASAVQAEAAPGQPETAGAPSDSSDVVTAETSAGPPAGISQTATAANSQPPGGQASSGQKAATGQVEALPHPHYPVSSSTQDVIMDPVSLNPPPPSSPSASAITPSPPGLLSTSQPPATASAPPLQGEAAVAASIGQGYGTAQSAPVQAAPSPWEKAFAFIKETHNPLLGSSENRLQAAQPALPQQPQAVSVPERGVGAGDAGPLSSDGFLKSYFGNT